MTEKKDLKDFNPFYMMATFWIGLGILIAASSYFPETIQGKITDLAAGFILIGLGLFALWRGKIASRAKDKM